MFSQGYGVAALLEGPACGRGRASKTASLAASHEGREIGHVPAEIGQLLVDALESHGCGVCVCVVCGVVVTGIAGVGVERVGVEELKWDVCAGKAVS